MKLRKLIGGLTLGVVAVSSALAGIFSIKIAEHKPGSVQEVSAGATVRLYLDMGSYSDWYKDSATFKVHTWNSANGDQLHTATKVSNAYWYCDVDLSTYASGGGYRFTRYNSTGSSEWNRGAWCTYVSGSNNTYKPNGMTSGNWSTVSTNGEFEAYVIASTTPSASTKRVWVNPKDTFYDSNARAGLRVFDDNGHIKTYILGGSSQYVIMTHETKSQYYFYVDIPVDANCQMVRLHNAFNYVWTYSTEFSNIDGWNPTLFMYAYNNQGYIAKGGLDSSSNYTVEFAKKFLDGYSTCESSTLNGYGAYSDINTNVLSNYSSSDLTTIRNSSFTASGYGARTYGEKIDRLSHSGNISARISPIFSILGQDNSASIIIVVVSLIAVSAVGGYFLLRKRKEQ